MGSNSEAGLLNSKKLISDFFPFSKALQKYTKGDFKDDLIAGLTVAVMLVPQGMAYAYLAGLPPIYGLYGGLIPLFIYALFGSSRQLSIGPVAISALLILAGISKISAPESEEYIQLVILAGLIIGIMQLLLSFLRMGFLVNFLSHPIIAGFSSAAAVIISINQLKDFLGIDIPRLDHVFETLQYTLDHLFETHFLTMAFGIGSLLIMLLLKFIHKSTPASLIVVVIGIILTKSLGLDEKGLAIVGEVPKGLPSFVLPNITWEKISMIMPTVLAVTIIGIVESVGIAKALEAKNQNYQIQPNQELFALGFSKVIGSFFQALPTSGSFSRSAINNISGAKSTIASVITALVVGLTLLFFTSAFFYLPKAILAAIILLAVKSLFSLNEAKHLYKVHRRDFFMMLITFIATLLFGIAEGVLIGVLLSIGSVLYLSSKPHMVRLGKVPGTNHYRNIERFDNAVLQDGTIVLRFDDQLYFGNATYFKSQIQTLINTYPEIDALLLDASSIHEIDSSGMQVLKEVINFLHNRKIHFYISGVIGPVRDRLFKSGLMDQIGPKRQFMYIDDAMQFMQEEGDESWKPSAIQTNISEDKKEQSR